MLTTLFAALLEGWMLTWITNGPEDSNDPLYKVECSGKNVVVTKKVKDEFGWGVDGFEEYYKSWCEDQKRRLKNGEIDMLI